jgi:hypothetical protein
VADADEIRLLYVNPLALLRDLRAAGGNQCGNAARPAYAAACLVSRSTRGIAAGTGAGADHAADGIADRMGAGAVPAEPLARGSAKASLADALRDDPPG